MRRYVSKPDVREKSIVVTQYTPDAPLGDLLQVAQMADRGAMLAEAEFPIGKVLIVRWFRSRDNGPGDIEYLAVPAEQWLCYSEEYDSLTADSSQGIDHWYTLADGG